MPHAPELPKRSWLVGAVNRGLSTIWKKGWLDHPQIDDDHLIDRISQETGLSDFGDDWFRRPLKKMVQALHEEARLNQLGAFVAEGQIKKVLRDRLWAQHWFDTHPEILQQPLPRPVIVVGPMRSGTTRLHRLLASDERFAHMRFFEAVSPTPKPNYRRGDTDPRPLTAKRILSAVHRANPRTAAIHPTAPMEPEEELGLLVASAWGMKHEAQWMIPSYGRWSEQQDATPAYQHLAKLLRLISWARGDTAPRPWVLKTPQHMLDLPALLQTFPDARLIFIHRDPVRVVGSACSLVWNQMIIHSDHVKGGWVGREWLRKTGLQIDRMRSARDDISPSNMIDVHYSQMDSDWEQVMTRIYDFLAMDIGPALPAMRRYIHEATRQGKARPHRYQLAAFGLDKHTVQERFSSYIDDYDLAASKPPSRIQFSAPTVTGKRSPAL
ncbi:MAG: sulfotransferase [Sphingobium sp.]